MRYNHSILIFFFVLAVLFAGLQNLCLAKDPITVQALAEKQEVTVGESFLLQIKIDGDDSPAAPDLSGLQDFVVEPKGGGQNNRESITIVNGKINRVSEHGYVYQYLLTPKQDGMLTIPAIEIVAGGQTLLTQPVPIRVVKPVVTDEFKLRVSLSETKSYVGHPLALTVKWYVNRNIADFRFDLPFLEDERFSYADFPEDRNYQGQDAISIGLPTGTVIARKAQEGQFTTVTLRQILIPREAGAFNLGHASVYSRIITGYQQKRGSQPFDDLFNRDFFDDVFGRRQAVYKQLVTESNDLKITVLPLPAENRPQNFSGLVGLYSLAAAASPTEVNVGDPITLNIMVTGSAYMDNVVFPPLENQQQIHDNFKVPEEMGPGEIDGRVKVFTQTIRAKHAAVKEIPSISLNFFNPETGQYETANTQAIPLQVLATKVFTARDAEGISSGIAKKELTSLGKGIAHNYVGEDIHQNQAVEVSSWFRSPTGLLLILFPPAVYFLVLVPLYLRRRRLLTADILLSQKALSEFTREVGKLKKGLANTDVLHTVSGLVEAMRIYLGRRLQMPPGALVYEEVSGRLQQHGVDQALLGELKKILDRCEAYHYGAMGMTARDKEDISGILDGSLLLFNEIDKCIKKR